MKTKGVIFDFGFTLFSFENPSVEKYMDCFRRGLLRSIETLKKENILTDKDILIEQFTKTFNSSEIVDTGFFSCNPSDTNPGK